MNDQQKAQAYDNLMMEHRRLDNQISQIRSENFELNEQQQNQVNQLIRVVVATNQKDIGARAKI